MTELFHTDLDDAAIYNARLANVERDRLLDEIARLRASAERDRDTWQRELAIELEQSQALGDALAAAVTALVSCRFDVPTGVVGVDFYALAQARDAARAWREARA